MAAGVNVSKVNLYAVTAPPPSGLKVSKVNLYAVTAALQMTLPVRITLRGAKLVPVAGSKRAIDCELPDSDHVDRAV